MPETTNPQPETAHALLYRHGLPEDVIDGALCLHAQELAAQIRSVTEQLKADGVLEPDKFRPCRDAADQIDPTREGSLYAPASPSAPADRAAILREAAEVAVRAARGCGDSEAGQYAASVAAGIGKELRRLADAQPASGPSRVAGEAQQDETQAPCPHCKGNRSDPDDPGDWIPEVGMHHPRSSAPCPECHGSGLHPAAVSQPGKEPTP
ncbi:hypothetical protein [Streptomyces mirabilis]|uniref:hypothetical protein n=1 Tax=Streptomyces mirabilis TaxID=68239 RepID=UPI0033D5CE89